MRRLWRHAILVGLASSTTSPFVAASDLEPEEPRTSRERVTADDGVQDGAAAPVQEGAPPAGPAPSLEERVERLEAENAELQRRIDVVADEQERLELGDVFPPLGEGLWGLGPAASKVYAGDGLSLGGYAEGVYTNYSGSTPDRADLLRAVLYVGYKFDEHWVFNSEFEFEHASTSESGEVSVEFAYLDYLSGGSVNGRAGLVLLPMGLINEVHEPTTFLTVTRPETARRIIPSTWRENGLGVFGDAGPFGYRAYVVNGFDATGFTAAGLRGGRQKGSKALANDLAVVARLDWVDTPGLLVGGSFYHGDSGQDQAGLGDTTTSIYELHADWRWRGLIARAEAAVAHVDDVAQLNAALGFTGAESVGEELIGSYVNLGYDVMSAIDPESPWAVIPYVQYERIDTQAEVPSGFATDPRNDQDILSLGIDVKPIDQIVFKLEFQDWELDSDRVNLSFGLVF